MHLFAAFDWRVGGSLSWPLHFVRLFLKTRHITPLSLTLGTQDKWISMSPNENAGGNAVMDYYYGPVSHLGVGGGGV